MKELEYECFGNWRVYKSPVFQWIGQLMVNEFQYLSIIFLLLGNYRAFTSEAIIKMLEKLSNLALVRSSISFLLILSLQQ